MQKDRRSIERKNEIKASKQLLEDIAEVLEKAYVFLNQGLLPILDKEREECARVCEQIGAEDEAGEMAQMCANKIRLRKNTIPTF